MVPLQRLQRGAAGLSPARSPAGDRTDAREVAFWWRQLGGAPTPRPALEGDAQADVAIVGAGYTGLWTAYELKRADPQLEVVVLEREFAGFGASGRNGGWLSGQLAGRRERYAKGSSREAVVAAQRAMFATVGEVRRRLEEEDVDCDLAVDGMLMVATNPAQLAHLRERLAYERSWGFGEEDWRELDRQELGARVRVDGALGGAFSPHCARVHPAKLVAGLATACERRGVRLYERTPVTAIEPGRAVGGGGRVRARWVVRAVEGYTADLPDGRRDLLPLNSSMIVTEPLDEEAWATIGWAGAETLHHHAHRYCYLQRSADGRIAIGGRGRPYRFGSRTDRAGEVPSAVVSQLRERLVDLFPALDGVRVADAWAGVLGVPRDWCPHVRADPQTGLCSAGGYVGHGVATAYLAARTLRDLILERDTELTHLPWVNRRAPRWEPEPLRWLAVHGVNALYRAADAAEERSGRPSRAARVADWVAGR